MSHLLLMLNILVSRAAPVSLRYLLFQRSPVRTDLSMNFLLVGQVGVPRLRLRRPPLLLCSGDAVVNPWDLDTVPISWSPIVWRMELGEVIAAKAVVRVWAAVVRDPKREDHSRSVV